jgi:hypothetical protein
MSVKRRERKRHKEKGKNKGNKKLFVILFDFEGWCDMEEKEGRDENDNKQS